MNELQNQPVVTAKMKIRRPVAAVFEAFIDPAVTVNFWFTHSSGKLVGSPGTELEFAL